MSPTFRIIERTKICSGSYENEDPENEDLRPPTKTKTHYENEDPSRKRRHVTKTGSKEVGITFVDKDYVHETQSHSNCGSPLQIDQWAAFLQKRKAFGPLFGPRTPRGRNRVHRKFEDGTSKLLIGT